MSAIHIHHCRLRLVRHGGWSWGPDPRTLLQAAIRALPALLAAALEGLWQEEDEREITTPVRLRLTVRQGDLLAAHAGFSGQGPPPAGSPAAELARRLAASLAVVLAGELPPERRGGEEPAPGSIATPDSHRMGALLPAGVSLSSLLRAWRDRGDLATRLALLSETALESWVEALFREGAQGGDSSVFPSTWAAEPAEEASRPGLKTGATHRAPSEISQSQVPAETTEGSPGFQAREVKAPSPLRHPAEDRAAAFRTWLMSTVEAAARRPAPSPESRPAALSPIPFPVSASPETPGPHPTAAAPSARPMPQRDAEVHVASALPFLMLGPLSRTGYLETLAATFAAAGLLGDLPLFAAALAAKALPPPERGWRRTPAAANAAAVCAGLLDPVSGEDLAGLARRASACLEPLAADLTASLLAGHEPGRPLLLAAAGEGLLLAEADGIFPIAWASGFEGLSPALTRLRDETLLVPAGIATPALLRAIDAGGHRFVTAAPPTRGEPWRPLRLPGGPGGDRAWTNGLAAPGLARQAARLAVAEDGARRLWHALAVERPSLPPAAGPALDRHLTLAAGVALGTLAWTLWRDREPVDPVLALERFGDLEARVRFHAQSVHVLLPLGRRHRDLSTHRLLEPIRDAVWLGGRVLELEGG
jgi:hypothetical protein